jgi:hypothetical protein
MYHSGQVAYLSSAAFVSSSADSSDSDLTVDMEEEDVEIDWNSQWQEVLEMPDDYNKLRSLSAVANDFACVAGHYGRIIISEYFLQTHAKTIFPSSIGGFAGGTKVVVDVNLEVERNSFAEGSCSNSLWTLKSVGSGCMEDKKGMTKR